MGFLESCHLLMFGASLLRFFLFIGCLIFLVTLRFLVCFLIWRLGSRNSNIFKSLKELFSFGYYNLRLIDNVLFLVIIEF